MVKNVGYNPQVFRSKAVLMQRCADHVRAGYFLHITGVVALSRAPALARKFRDLYLVHLDRNSRHRRKVHALGNAHLLFWLDPAAEGSLVFVLLVTPGDHAANVLEELHDARKQGSRLQVTGYELVQQTRAGSAIPSWTWRMTADTYHDWRERVRRTIRALDDLGLKQIWYSLHQVPGFAPIRRQVRKLKQLVREEYRRLRSGDFPLAPEKLRYVERLPNITVPLSTLLSPTAVADKRRSASVRQVATPHGTSPKSEKQRKHHECKA